MQQQKTATISTTIQRNQWNLRLHSTMITMRSVFICFFFGLISTTCQSQNTFMKTLGTNSSDYGTACIATDDLGALVLTGGGMSSGNGVQFGLAKTSSDGTLEWQKVFNYGSFALGYDAVAVDDGYCVLGTIDGNPADKSLFLMKTDLAGNEVWNYQIPASANDRPAKLLACKSGGFLSCSIYNYNTGGYPEGLLTRFDANGSILWSRRYSVLQGIQPKSVVELSDGGFAMVSSVNAQFLTYPEHTLITRVDSTGLPMWSHMYSSNYFEEPFDIVANANDELFVAGTRYHTNSAWDGFLLKTDASGNGIFNQFYEAGTSNGEIFRQVVLNATGDAILLGDFGSFDQRNITMLEVSQQSGEIHWANQYPISPQFTNYPADVYVAENGEIVFTGDVRPPSYFRDAALIRTDSQGQVMCYTEPTQYATDNTPFSEMDIFVNSLPATITGQTPIVFTHPLDNITEKVICENLEPAAEISWANTSTCPEVCLDFSCASSDQIDVWYWEFNGASPSNSNEQNPQNICFPEGGTYKVNLYISNSDGTFLKELDVLVQELDCPLGEIPNVFSPNGDGTNEVFYIEGLTGNFTMTIVNRWGEVVFETSEPNTFWDGKNKNGQPVSEGVYFYKISKNKNVKHGFLHLVR